MFGKLYSIFNQNMGKMVGKMTMRNEFSLVISFNKIKTKGVPLRSCKI